MASLKTSILLNTISFCVIALIAAYVVTTDQCTQLCGYIAPTTFPEFNKTCDTTGKVLGTATLTINWNDGSYTTFTVIATTQIAIGSCCSAFQSAYLLAGTVISGRFSGEKFTIAKTFRDVRQTCNGCQTGAGLYRVSSPYLLSIGTKGVGDWIECTGNATLLWSPGVNNEPQDVHTTEYVDFTDCSNCVQSC